MTLSEFFHFLWVSPVADALILLVLLLTVVPVAVGLYRGRRHKNGARARAEDVPTTRFVGIQLDVAILVLGLIVLVVLIGWVRQAFLR